MNTRDLNTALREEARFLGLCDHWYNAWKNNCKNEELVAKMYKGLDFCIKNHWPSNDFILKHFDINFLRKNNVFVNDKYSVVSPNESLILGTSEMTIRYNADSYGNIHIRDNSVVKLTARNRSFVIVHMYENASISAEQFDKATVVIVKHSQNVHITAEENIKVREEYDYLK